MKNWLDKFEGDEVLDGNNPSGKVNKQKCGGITKAQGGTTKSKLHTLNMNPLYEQAIDNTRNMEPHLQNGGWLNNYALQKTFLEPNSEKLPEGYASLSPIKSTELSTSIGGENGEPAYLIPSFKYGKVLQDPVQEFRDTGDHLGGPFKTWQEADEWGRNIRHPYVEKGQSLPSPLLRKGKEMKVGGVVKDNQGYWNPDNWGKPVEIDSNHITMKGVNQPLIGISDTGHTQMMYPGQDYHFEGNRVTELPMAQKGITLSGPTIRGKKYPKGTIVTNDPNDPRLQAFRDSTDAYNYGMQTLKDRAQFIKEQQSLGANIDIYVDEDVESLSDFRYNPKVKGLTSGADGDGTIAPVSAIYAVSGIPKNIWNDNVAELGGADSFRFLPPQQKVVYNPIKEVALTRNSNIARKPEYISAMKPLGFPQPVVTPNQGTRPDAIYRERPDGHYKQGLFITHRTDPLGRWAAQINTKPSPGVDGKLTTFPEGVHNVEYKYQDGGWLSKYD